MKCPNCNANVTGRFCEYCLTEIKEFTQEPLMPGKKYCKYCAKQIPKEAVICVHCGCQVETISSPPPNIFVNNNNTGAPNNHYYKQTPPLKQGKRKDKWIAFTLCLLFGFLGVHKFYEGKVSIGIAYMFTFGLFGIGWLVDIIAILRKPDPYYV